MRDKVFSVILTRYRWRRSLIEIPTGSREEVYSWSHPRGPYLQSLFCRSRPSGGYCVTPVKSYLFVLEHYSTKKLMTKQKFLTCKRKYGNKTFMEFIFTVLPFLRIKGNGVVFSLSGSLSGLQNQGDLKSKQKSTLYNNLCRLYSRGSSKSLNH